MSFAGQTILVSIESIILKKHLARDHPSFKDSSKLKNLKTIGTEEHILSIDAVATGLHIVIVRIFTIRIST